MMFVNGMTAGIAYALRGMHLQLSGMQDAGRSYKDLKQALLIAFQVIFLLSKNQSAFCYSIECCSW